jgi:hypothetical protein
MDEIGIDDSLSDDRLTREIGALMDVQPSPEFIARIRTRVEREPVRSTWVETRLLAFAGAAACLVVIVLTWASWPERHQAPRAPLVAATPTAASVRIEPQSTPPEIVTSPTPSGSVRVLVSPEEAAGLRYLVSALHDGRLDPDVLPDSTEEFGPPMPLVIEPITVEPLVAAADVESGVLQ